MLALAAALVLPVVRLTLSLKVQLNTKSTLTHALTVALALLVVRLTLSLKANLYIKRNLVN
jgi:hypothetical protein